MPFSPAPVPPPVPAPLPPHPISPQDGKLLPEVHLCGLSVYDHHRAGVHAMPPGLLGQHFLGWGITPDGAAVLRVSSLEPPEIYALGQAGAYGDLSLAHLPVAHRLAAGAAAPQPALGLRRKLVVKQRAKARRAPAAAAAAGRKKPGRPRLNRLVPGAAAGAEAEAVPGTGALAGRGGLGAVQALRARLGQRQGSGARPISRSDYYIGNAVTHAFLGEVLLDGQSRAATLLCEVDGLLLPDRHAVSITAKGADVVRCAVAPLPDVVSGLWFRGWARTSAGAELVMRVATTHGAVPPRRAAAGGPHSDSGSDDGRATAPVAPPRVRASGGGGAAAPRLMRGAAVRANAALLQLVGGRGKEAVGVRPGGAATAVAASAALARALRHVRPAAAATQAPKAPVAPAGATAAARLASTQQQLHDLRWPQAKRQRTATGAAPGPLGAQLQPSPHAAAAQASAGVGECVPAPGVVPFDYRRSKLRIPLNQTAAFIAHSIIRTHYSHHSLPKVCGGGGGGRTGAGGKGSLASGSGSDWQEQGRGARVLQSVPSVCLPLQLLACGARRGRGRCMSRHGARAVRGRLRWCFGVVWLQLPTTAVHMDTAFRGYQPVVVSHVS